MKSNSKFFLGLTLGLALGFVAFNIGSANSTNNKVDVSTAMNDATNGDFITAADAMPLEQNFKNYMTSLNQSQASIGGVIGESNLRDLTRGLGGNGLISYKFYKAPGEGDAKIGVIFYNANGKVLKSGSAAFCPMVCDPSN